MRDVCNNISIAKVFEQTAVYDAMIALSDSFFNQTVDKKTLSQKLFQHGTFKMAICDGVIAGFIGYYVNDKDSKTAFLSTIVISKGFHRRGIGTLLLRDCFSDCRSKGMAFCRLEVEKSNVSAINFYKRFGFEKEKESSEKSDYYICSL